MAEYTPRQYQIENLAVAIKMRKHLDRSHPATGKSGTASLFAWYVWARHAGKTVYAMPQSLLRNNRIKMLQFTNFAPEDVVILTSDHAPLTRKWDGPTKLYPRRVKSQRWRITDPATKKRHLTHERVMTPEQLTWEREPIVGPDGNPQFQKGHTEGVEVKDLIAAAKDAKVFIITFAFLREHWRHLLACHPDINNLMIDEAHLGFKRPDSAQTEAMLLMNRHVDFFYPMSGSLPDGPLDSLFPIIHAIEPLYYASHADFLAEHVGLFDQNGRPELWINTEKLSAILDRHSTCRTFEECYGDDPVVFHHEMVEVTNEVRTEYDKFHSQAMLELEDGRILDGTMPGVSVIRARQILAHPETLGIAVGKPTGKDERLKIFAHEGQPMLVFASLKPEQRRCVEVLKAEGLRVGLINSDVPKRERDRIDLAFRRGELDAIVASGPTAGVGYDWERADHVVVVSPDYQDVNFMQGYRRASRGTRTKPYRVTTLEYESTVEGRCYNILADKSALATRVDKTRKAFSFTG